MLPTYEAILQPDGRLQFVDGPAAAAFRAPQRVLVTFIDERVSLESLPGGQPRGVPFSADWQALAGMAKNSPQWQGDPLAIQQDMRREWD